MRRLLASLKRLAGWRARAAREREFREELEAHFQLHIEDNLRAGMPPAEARRHAALKFGSVDSATEAVRGQWTVAWMESTRQDLVYALRTFRRNPAFAVTAVLSLALGIGASVAIFTVADGVLLRPLPYRDPSSLMMVWETNPQRTGAARNIVSPANYRDWKAQNHVFEEIAAFGYGRVILTDGQRAEEFPSQFLSAEVLPMLGVRPWRGRLFTLADTVPRGPDVMLISYHLWRTWFAGDEGIVGRKIQVSDRLMTVIGVMPPGFYLRDRDVELWGAMPLNARVDFRKSGDGRYQLCVARLKPGVTQQQSQTEMSAIARRLEAAYPEFNKGWGVNVEPLRDSLVRAVKPSLIVLLAAVFLLLAVACANVANLLLARHGSRRREMAVRAAIGAGRWRIARQLLTESLVLGLTGGALGILSAKWALAGLLALAPQDLARNASIVLDLRIVGFAVALSLASAIAFGLIPSWMAARRDALSGLNEGGRSGIGGHALVRKLLVASEVAFSVMLLAGAGLMFRSLAGLQSVDPGIRADHVLTFRVTLPRPRYNEYLPRVQFYSRALEDIRALSGVRSASAIDFLPFNGLAPATGLIIAGRPPARPGETLVTVVRTVEPGYFHLMGIPLKSGRDFAAADNAPDSPYRFIVSERFARQYLAGEQPLGKQIGVDLVIPNPFGEIIGVAADVREGAIDKEPAPTVYFVHGHMQRLSMAFVVRTAGDPLALAEPVRRIIHRLDVAQPVVEMNTMDNVVRETFSRQTFTSVLLGGFSLVSLLLAGVGIYGVLAYSVAERTREFGVRVALGAEPAGILSLVLMAAARIVAAGTVVGIGGALALTTLLRAMLFGVGPRDTATFVAVPLVLALVGFVAAWVPARRAARLAPTEALRAE